MKIVQIFDLHSVYVLWAYAGNKDGLDWIGLDMSLCNIILYFIRLFYITW